MPRVALLLVLLTACTTEVDPIDESTCLPQEVFKIDQVRLPRNNVEARSFGFELSGDANIDNNLGSISATFGSMFEDYAVDVDQRLATDVEWTLALRQCGEHVVVEGGDVPLGLLFDTTGIADAGFVPAIRAEIRIDGTRTEATLDAALGLAFDHADARTTVTSAMTPFIIARGEQGDATLLDVFDVAPHDGQISETEVATSSLMESLLAWDIRVDDEPASSLGLRIHATRVR